jgi:hypothetical protein
MLQKLGAMVISLKRLKLISRGRLGTDYLTACASSISFTKVNYTNLTQLLLKSQQRNYLSSLMGSLRPLKGWEFLWRVSSLGDPHSSLMAKAIVAHSRG